MYMTGGGEPTDGIKVLEPASRTLNWAGGSNEGSQGHCRGRTRAAVLKIHTFTPAGSCENYTKVTLNMRRFFNLPPPLFFSFF